MKFRRHRTRRPGSTDEETAEALTDSNYDAQTDLALPESDRHTAADGFVPFAGELAPEPSDAGYDVARDTGINP
jgi:hypothetical protein